MKWCWYQNLKTDVWYRTRPDDFLLYSRIGPNARSRGYQVQLQDFVEEYFKTRSTRTAIDVGAHTGMTSVFYSQIFDCVKAFEPIPELCTQFRLTIERNKCNNVELYSHGIGKGEELIKMKYKANNSFNSHRNDKGNIEASITSLDSLNIDAVDFIKIDVEGMESEVIEGAWETILRHQPLIQFEYKQKQTKKQNNNLSELCEQLEKADYTIVDKKNVSHKHSELTDMFAIPF
jgi:FkbM family methyltransferase